LRELIYVTELFLIPILLFGHFSPLNGQVLEDHAEAITKDKIYKFNWDYIITYGDNPDDLNIEKNSNNHQVSVYVNANSIINATVHTCCGDFGRLTVSIGGEVKVSSNGSVYISEEKPATRIGGCDDEDCDQIWLLPHVQNGTYNLIYFVRGETEVNELYITPVKIS
jgi:hypothetical protein